MILACGVLVQTGQRIQIEHAKSFGAPVGGDRAACTNATPT